MPLVDWQIDELCKQGMVDPYDDRMLNPASLDVTVGDWIEVESADPNHVFIRHDLRQYSIDNPFNFKPNAFILTELAQTFHIPDHISADFKLCSSPGRSGFENALAGWIDNGYNGSRLTLELKNNLQYHSIPLFPGLIIGQIVFWNCDELPRESYRNKGRYNGDPTVSQSKGLKAIVNGEIVKFDPFVNIKQKSYA